MDIKEQIISAFNYRHACKEFDPNKKIPEDDFQVILEAARLSPSSFGFEPWKFLIIQNQELRNKISAAWGAKKQLITASHFVVLLARVGADMRYNSDYIRNTMAQLHLSPPDVIEARLARAKSFQEIDFNLIDDRALFDWACKQTYIALANMLTTAALLGIDSCPIEGFNRAEIEDVLVKEDVLDKSHFGIACMAAFGYRALPPKRQKIRRKLQEVSEWIK